MAMDDGKRTLTLTPRLRFPEFRKDGGWQSTPLEDIAKRVSTRNDDGSVTRVLTNSAEHGVLDQRDYFDREIATLGKTDGYFIVDEGDFVYNPRKSVIAPVGPISRNNIGKGVMSPLYTVFRFNKRDTDFFDHYFRSTGWHSYLRNKSSTGARHDRMAITAGAFMRLPIPTPAPAEQQKIAECLTSLDELIAAQGRKVDALSAHKRGLMQQLFPRDGETLPRRRFPEFRDAPEWEERNGGALFANRKTKGEDGLPIYSVTIHDGMVRRDSFDRDFYDIEDAAGNRKACKNDIVYNMMRMWQGACGVAPEDCLVSPAYVILSPLKGVHSEFFGYFFKLPASLLLLTSYSRGLTKDRLRLYYDDFAKMPLRVPGEAEQQRIADCLSSLDAKIVAESEKLDALKTHKKGLMQQLFPPAGERLNDQ
jgi:type I restriction enzyme S subunit